jgi:hypothetical protein
MTGAEAREHLEAVIWRERGGDPHRPAEDVDRILAAAWNYAMAYADERDAGRERLAIVTAERAERKH